MRSIFDRMESKSTTIIVFVAFDVIHGNACRKSQVLIYSNHWKRLKTVKTVCNPIIINALLRVSSVVKCNKTI